MDSKKIIKKVIILAVVFFLIGSFIDLINPITKNALAMKQMEIDILSNTWVGVYDWIISIYPWFVVIVLFLSFRKELTEIFKSIIRKTSEMKGEKEHEEN